ncbi:MAG: 16S rRNA (guanine(527)-N(7))-methyltransferase RsmG [Oscillospiraceae bacterium]|jgi:16S rRNA (guanine527-N7)-methyltransferase|nr:16S rRNA (guanine(527)-N(7))-methyltransferase RsmG [Oscillospiraceae bacterium]
MIDTEKMRSIAADMGIALEGKMLTQLDTYARLLTEKNKVMNLTRIEDADGIVVKHFADSLTLLTSCDIPLGASLIDVGTGAGFPGMVLSIARPDLSVTLLDSTKKRLDFLLETAAEIGVTVAAAHFRAEDAGRSPSMRERYDVVCARAVARLSVLAEYCLPLCAVGGVFISMKGPAGEVEAAEAARAVGLLGGVTREARELVLPDGSERTIIVIDKTKRTGGGYPRPQAKIKAMPL